MFRLNGLTGFLLLVVVLLSIWGALVFTAWNVQTDNVTNYYTLEEHQEKIKKSINKD
ncbi:MAG: hypothetical protein ACI86H_000359 [bacterium]|jgi:hypothetical protein